MAGPGPLLLSTWSFARRGHDHAWPALSGGGTALDAVETVCRVIEADPEVDSVGFGGLPDAEGGMSLDACVMLGPGRIGGVAGVRRHLHVTTIARAVMERTSHALLVGEGADAFAERCGIEPADLLAPDAAEAWSRWRRAPADVDQSRDGSAIPRPVDVDGGRLFGPAAGTDPAGSGTLGPESGHDTVGTLAVDRAGVVAGACSTSGTPYKCPGRVGDSPIIGHGLYVEPGIGAATATGSGELITGVCGSFLAVEVLRRGGSPIDAVTEVIARVVALGRVELELRPHHQVAVIALATDGRWATGALRPGFKAVIRTTERHEAVEADHVELQE